MCSRFGWISSKPPHCFSDTIEVSSSKHVKSVERWKWNVKKWENPSKNSAHFPFYFTKKGIIWRKSRKCDFLRLSLFVLLERSRETWNLCALRGKIPPSHDTSEGEQGSDFVTKWTHKKVGKNNSRQEDEGEEGKKIIIASHKQAAVELSFSEWNFSLILISFEFIHSQLCGRLSHFHSLFYYPTNDEMSSTPSNRCSTKWRETTAKNFLLLFPPLQMIFIFRSSWELRKTKQVRRKNSQFFTSLHCTIMLDQKCRFHAL